MNAWRNREAQTNEEQTKPKRHYYARYHDYGIDTLIENSDGTIERFPGTIMRFARRKVGDAWVDDEIWDGTFRREAMSARNLARALRSPARRGSATRWEASEKRTDGWDYEVLGCH